jgi:hypothetical protein
LIGFRPEVAVVVPCRAGSSAILFFEFYTFQVGNEELKPRIGSRRVAKALVVAWGSIWIGGYIMIWLGFLPPSAIQTIIPLALPFVIADFVYLMLYPLPPRKSVPDNLEE